MRRLTAPAPLPRFLVDADRSRPASGPAPTEMPVR
jgi:hypothetical protein